MKNGMTTAVQITVYILWAAIAREKQKVTRSISSVALMKVSLMSLMLSQEQQLKP